MISSKVEINYTYIKRYECGPDISRLIQINHEPKIIHRQVQREEFRQAQEGSAIIESKRVCTEWERKLHLTINSETLYLSKL